MEGSSFKDTPVSRALIFWVIGASIIASLTETKYYFYLQIVPHLWEWRQFWRVLTWQTCYTNSTEVLFAVTAFYQLRVIERLWGSRKFLSFVLVSLFWTLIVSPLLTIALRPLSFGTFNYIPAGPTPLLFAILAQFSATIPYTYRYRVGTSAPSNAELAGVPSSSLTLTSKATSYLIPFQMALSQFPHTILPAFIGWAVGSAYRNDVLPWTTWRVPRWLVGQGRTDKKQLDAIRRRLEEEAEGSGTGVERMSTEGEPLRRR